MTNPTGRLSDALADRYRIERELGQGGMATVYLAEDLKHRRKVALKVLKPELAAVLGAERFVQEITTTASMSHPHILPLFDSGSADGFLFYVMPFIDGETLRDKLNRETQLGVDEAVRIAREVADALDYAHRHGVIHRDIKPENILLHDGRPMVADFGIALAVSAAAGGRMTETGLSLGTPHYMSPEQATAEKEISARSDVYSLASVLYEMLAGHPPHSGGSAQQIIMKIITEAAAPVTHMRRSVPSNVSAAVVKALEKLPADRFASAKEFADALADPHFAIGTPAVPAGALASRPQRTAILALGAALGIMTVVAGWALLRSEPPYPVHRFALSLPDPQLPDPLGYAAISPDGSRIVYLGRSPRSAGLTQLWVKSRDSLEAVLLGGTETASAIAISPDNLSIAFIQAGNLRRMPIAGGALTVVAQRVSNVSGAVAWLDDNSIVYVDRDQKLVRIPSSGGTGTVLWSADSVTLSSLTPLPGARGVLFQACRAPCSDGNLWVLDLRTTSARELQRNARVAHYLPTGHLLYVQDDVMIAVVVPFDLKSLQMRGDPTPVLDSVAFDAGTTPYLDVSASGTLIMRRGTTVSGGEFDLVWVDRTGRETVVDSSFRFRVTQTAGNYAWALSPDGSRLAIGLNTTEGDDIWTKALPRGPARRLTFSAESEARPRWTRDGRSVTYLASNGIFLRRADGTGSDSMLWRGLADEAALSPDGTWLLLRRGATSASSGGRDIFAIRNEAGDTTLTPVVVTSYDESALGLSPDGRWIAYTSDETGQVEVFVRPFPNTNDGKEQISNGGGRAPLWSRDGREFYYLRGDNTMMAVPVPSGADWARGEPRELFRVREALTVLEPSYYTPWDVGPDGRFIFARSIDRGRDRRAPLIVMENWIEELKARVRR